MGAPCATFSAARTGPPGPRALRGLEHPYGFPKAQLAEQEAEQVRLGGFFALKSLDLASAAVGARVGLVLENPEPRSGVVSLFTLPEAQAASELPGVYQ
eukprot:4098117-Lingulodinium_polyedra.AAC.1